MRRLSTICATIATFTVLVVGLAGCDSSPNSIEDFDVQGTLDSPAGITVIPSVSPSFTVSYQGLENPPTASFASSAGDYSIEQDSVTGDPVQGGTSQWTVTLTAAQIEEAIQTAGLVIEGTDQSSGRAIRDTVSVVSTTKLLASTNFTSSFLTIADYEGDVDSTNIVDDGTPNTLENDEPYTGDQRSIQTSSASTTLKNADPSGFALPQGSDNTPQGSNGVRSLTVSTSGGNGSVTIQRDMNLPDSDAFSFLVKPAAQSFTLTLTFTELDGDSEVSHDLQVPVNPGTGWLRLGIPFSEINQDLDPVAPRSGGNGGLVSITLTADKPVSFGVDQMLFGTISNEEFLGRAEFHDFERSTNAYGSPFGGGSNRMFRFLEENLAAGSDGLWARRVTDADGFGYNYGGGLGPPAMAFLDVDGNDVLSFYGKGFGESRTIDVFVESPAGGSPSSAVTRTLPADSWQKIEIPLSAFGSPGPSDFLDPGIRNVGFEACGDCGIDDIKIVPKQ
ncbi:MAG: hypothetical protein ABEK75_05465 [Salinibacter sp.]